MKFNVINRPIVLESGQKFVPHFIRESSETSVTFLPKPSAKG